MKNYSKTKVSSSTNLPVVKLESNAVLKITDDFNRLVKYLCGKINTIEWSGILFFTAKGDVQDKDGIEITPIDIFPMDKGSAGYTEYDIGEEVFDYYEHHPERFGMKYGHIHSHHNMDAYFSGTDMKELVDNCVNHSYYVSVIVNNSGKIVGKIAIVGERENKSSSNYTLKGLNGKEITIPQKNDNKIPVMYTIDLDVQKESIDYDELFLSRVETIMKPKPTPVRTFVSSDYKGDTVPQTWNSPELPFPGMNKKDLDVEPIDVLKLCLGDDIGSSRILSDIFNDILLSESSDDDILFYLQQSLDVDAVIDSIRNLQRDFFEQPDYEKVIAFYTGAEKIANSYIHGKYKKVANMMIVTIVKELKEIKQAYEG